MILACKDNNKTRAVFTNLRFMISNLIISIFRFIHKKVVFIKEGSFCINFIGPYFAVSQFRRIIVSYRFHHVIQKYELFR